MTFDLDSITWTCHLCGKERPDRLISVFCKEIDIGHGGAGIVTENIRYCNDDQVCRSRAPYFRHFNKETIKVPFNDKKYVTFKKQEFVEWLDRLEMDDSALNKVADAVVIRRQDSFAPAALSAYAMNIAMAAKILDDEGMGGKARELQEIADYFSDQADLAMAESFKLPD